ncbi:hypothetical protein [Vibrio phage vB_pir03]|nr:hypothetical protein [Vibrio phage vB_pir03]
MLLMNYLNKAEFIVGGQVLLPTDSEVVVVLLHRPRSGLSLGSK